MFWRDYKPFCIFNLTKLEQGQSDSSGEYHVSFEQVSQILESTLSSTILPDSERIISIPKCPVCRKKIKQSFSDFDVISHVSLCMQSDLTLVDKFLTGGLLTEQYASRKWFTKILSYVTFGNYSIGKTSGNILVQDRSNGQLIEEKMPAYIRLGIRVF